MRVRKPIKVVSATSHQVIKFTRPTDFREGKIKTYLSELGIDAKEFKLKSAIRLELRLIDKGLTTIQ
jgi:hypothetical protein